MKSIIAGFITLTLTYQPLALAVGSGGFENASFSAVSLAQANAVVAQADEPAAISYNPAGIIDLSGVQIQSNMAGISLFTFYDGEDVGQGKLQSAGTLAVIPTAYATINPGGLLNDRLAFGIGSDSPFGLSNKYDSTHPAVRYTTGAKNWIKMFTIKPVMALRVTDKWSIGGGPVWNRVFSAGSYTQYPNFSIVPGSVDGELDAKLSGNSWGWQLGTKYKLNEKHQFGMSFRSPSNINLKGRVHVKNPVLAGNVEVGARAKLSLPLNFTFAYAFRPTEKTVVEMDLGWTKWSQFKRLVVHADPVTTSSIGAINTGHDTLISALGRGDEDYSDSFSLHLGGQHKLTDKLTLRGGSHFYWAARPKNHFRPNLPDANSVGFSLGTGYKLFENLKLDAAYYIRYWYKRSVNNDISETLGTSVDGDYRSFAQEFILSLTYEWDAFDAWNDHTSIKESHALTDEKDYRPILGSYHQNTARPEASGYVASNPTHLSKNIDWE